MGDEVLVGAHERDNDELLEEEGGWDIVRNWLFKLLFGIWIKNNNRYIEGGRHGNRDV